MTGLVLCVISSQSPGCDSERNSSRYDWKPADEALPLTDAMPETGEASPGAVMASANSAPGLGGVGTAPGFAFNSFAHSSACSWINSGTPSGTFRKCCSSTKRAGVDGVAGRPVRVSIFATCHQVSSFDGNELAAKRSDRKSVV